MFYKYNITNQLLNNHKYYKILIVNTSFGRRTISSCFKKSIDNRKKKYTNIEDMLT